ncbi:MAG TPA: hypothetical protein PK263_03525 [bacterium]|nr:hypothetical protein [bacterium]
MEPRPSFTTELPDRVARAAQELLELRDNYDSEIPHEIVFTGDFKVRKNWFNAVNIFLFVVKEFVNADTKLKIETFDRKVTDPSFQGDSGRLVTKEDIVEADELISITLAQLDCS